MAIPEAQLETWSHQGPTGQFTATYQTLKGVLHDQGSAYARREFSSFLQGSYANDTNIYADSDVDVVMRLDQTFYTDLQQIPSEDQQLYERLRSPAEYALADFKREVLAWLSKNYNGVKEGKKAIFVPGSGTRRDVDVLVAARLRRYSRFKGWADQTYVEGICFFLPDGTRIDNFPEQHSANCIRKHQETNTWFKRTVRIYKNMRNYMIGKQMIEDGLAPSYFIEGLLYNVPTGRFGGSYVLDVKDTLEWLLAAEKTTFLCANEQYYLLRDNSLVCWPPAKCERFLNQTAALWRNW
jgi:hypothetical protein